MRLYKNGKLVNGEAISIGVENGLIIAINPTNESGYSSIIDLDGNYISAGWIDMHTHCYERMDLYYDDPDEIGYKTGVTTVIDAGTTGALDIGTFYADTRLKKTRVYAMINIAKQGIKTQNELADLNNIDIQMIDQAIMKYPDFVIGFKVRMSASVIGDNGIVPLEIAKSIQTQFQKPLMVHIGSNPPLLVDILTRLETGDIVTHIFNGKENGILNHLGKVRQEVWDAHNRGVIFDIGHGRESFSFDVALQAFKECLLCDTISSDIYHHNRVEGPVYSLAHTMNKLLSVGYSLERVIEMVTVRPAEIMSLPKLGTLVVGNYADLTIFKEQAIHQSLVDSHDMTRTLERGIQVEAVVIKGEYIEL